MSQRTETIERGKREPLLYVFAAGFCMMVIELVAGRIVAPYLGSSLYTWTGVIGVVLLGMAVGNYAGGVMAERGAAWRSVSAIFAFAGLAAASSYYTYLPASELVYGLGIPIIPATFMFAFVGFFPVSFLLSLITPIVVALTLPSVERAGTTVGRIYAISSLASILGTFVTGYLLIPFLGVKTVVLTVAALLLLVSILASRGRTTGRPAVHAAVVLLWLGLLGSRFCSVESAYYCINVEPSHSERGSGYRLVLDRLTHSFVFSDPTVLEYDYETVYGVVAEYAHERLGASRPLRTLSIGGGGYTMPKFVQENYPGSLIDVVEIDPEVTEVNERLLGLNPDGQIRTFNEDARVFFARGAEGGRYDLIFGDAFNDYSIPYHLTTLEFSRAVHDRLTPDGIYALNMIDDSSDGRLLASFLRTMGEVFSEIDVSTVGRSLSAAGRNTFVILASDRPIDRDAWRSAASEAYTVRIAAPQSLTLDEAAGLLDRSQVRTLAERRGGIRLTDNYAPVDSLVAPLFSRRQ
ncbi:MAG: fused MFS/spermidine synthase [bacterium]